MGGDALEQARVRRSQCHRVQPTVLVGLDVRHDDDAHGRRGPPGVRCAVPVLPTVGADGQTLHAGGLARRLPGEVLEVLRGHRPVPGAQEGRPTDHGVLHRLPCHATGHRAAVLHPCDVGQARLGHPHDAPRHVAPPPAARPVGRETQPRATRRCPSVGAQRAVGLAHRRAELHHALRRVDAEDTVPWLRPREVLDGGPRAALAAGRLRPQHAHLLPGDDRAALQVEALAGGAVGDPEHLVADHLGVHHRRRAADRAGREPVDPRGLRVGRPTRPCLDEPAAQPPGPLLRDHGRRVLPRDVQHHVARAVEPAGLVAVDLAGRPAPGGPRLPLQRRAAGVDADPPEGAVETQDDRARGDRLVQADEQRVADGRRGREAVEAVAVAELPGVVDGIDADTRRGRGGQRAREDAQVLEGREHHRVLDVGAVGRDPGLGPHEDRLRPGRGQPERDLAARRRRRAELHAEELEELDVVPLGHAVEPVHELVDHLGEGLDERDAGVGHVVVGPLRATSLDEPLGLVDEVLEAAVVQVGGVQHRRHLPGARSSGRACSTAGWSGIT